MLLDHIYMGGRLSYEYLDIHPCNIYYAKYMVQKFFISNFGLQQHPKFQIKYSATSDRFLNSSQRASDRPID